MAFIRFFFAFSQKKINLLTARPNYFSPFRIFIFSIFDFLKESFHSSYFQSSMIGPNVGVLVLDFVAYLDDDDELFERFLVIFSFSRQG
jgi:hypothetical protein